MRKKREQERDLELVLTVRGAGRPSLKQLRYLYKFYSQREILATKIAVFVLLAAGLALGVVVYQTRLVTVPATGGEYVEAVAGAPNYVNPLFSQANGVDQDLTKLIFSGLVKENGRGEIVPDLAESFTVDQAQTTYTFILKPNLRWHDGEPLTAGDALFTIQAAKNRDFKSALYSALRAVEAKAVDERTVTLTLSEPFTPFLSLLTFGILPEHLWQEIEPGHALLADLNLKPVGSGPYQFASFTKDKKGNILEYRLKRFKDYYGPGPFIANITLKFFPTQDEAALAVESGNADGVGLTAGRLPPALERENGLTKHQLALPQYTALFFNQAANPALSEKAVREALELALDRGQIIAAAWPQSAEPIAGPIPGQEGSLPFDPAKAREMLSNRKDKDALVIKLTTIQKEENIQAAEKIRALWQEAGVTVNLEIADLNQIQSAVIKPRAYEILLFGQILGSDPDPYPFWHSSQINDPGLNLAAYANKEADKLLEQARRTTDKTAREKYYEEFAKKLQADLPAIFLYRLKFTYLLPARVRGVSAERIAQPADRFHTVNEWYIKTKKRIKL